MESHADGFPTEREAKSALGRDLGVLDARLAIRMPLIWTLASVHIDPVKLAGVLENQSGMMGLIRQGAVLRSQGRLSDDDSIPGLALGLGLDCFRSLGLELLLRLLLTSKEGGFNDQRRPKCLNRLFLHSLSVAAFAKTLATLVQPNLAERAFQAGLLHDLGRAAIHLFHGPDLEQDQERIGGALGPAVDRERALLGLGHAELSAFLLQRWGFDHALVTAAWLHHGRLAKGRAPPEILRLTAIVQWADYIAWTQGLSASHTATHPIISPEAQELIDWSLLDIPALFRSYDHEMALGAETHGVQLPSGETIRQNMFQAHLQLGRINSTLHFQAPPEKTTGLKPSVLAPYRSLQEEQIIRQTLEALFEDFRFNLLTFLKIDRHSRRLAPGLCLVQGRESPSPIINPIELVGGNRVLLDCMRNRRPLLLRGRNRSERAMVAWFGDQTLGLAPISHGDRIHGLLGICPGDARLDREIMLEALSVTQELALALSKSEMVRSLKREATTDALTGLLNRREIDHVLNSRSTQVDVKKRPFSVIMLDIDHFKEFNDRFGHPEGDRILKLISRLICKNLRADSHAGRYGGEEFIIVMEASGLADAIGFAERIRKLAAELGHLLGKRLPGRPLTISLGVASWESDIENPKKLVSQADQALYRAKEDGRNRVMAFVKTPQLPEAVLGRDVSSPLSTPPTRAEKRAVLQKKSRKNAVDSPDSPDSPSVQPSGAGMKKPFPTS